MLQRKSRNEEIKRRITKGKQFLIGKNGRPLTRRQQLSDRLHVNHQPNAFDLAQSTAQNPVMRAKVSRDRKCPFDDINPVRQVFRNSMHKEIVLISAMRYPPPARLEERPVEWLGHRTTMIRNIGFRATPIRGTNTIITLLALFVH